MTAKSPMRGRREAILSALTLCFSACAPVSNGSPDGADVHLADAGTGDARVDAAGCRTDTFEWGRGDEWMLPGSDCNACHREGGSARTIFSVAGTVTTASDCTDPAPNVLVHVFDSDGRRFTLRSNEVGNFWTEEPLRAPYTFTVERDGAVIRMYHEVVEGSCAVCHHLRDRVLGYVFHDGRARE